MRLYGTINYFEWAQFKRAEFKSFDLIPIIDGTLTESAPLTVNTSRSEVRKAVDYQHKNSHARKLIIDSLSDDVYAGVFANLVPDDALLSNTKSLWDKLKTTYQEKDVVAQHLSLQHTLSQKWDATKPLEVHLQIFTRTMLHLNTLASSHGLETIPEWYQIFMLKDSIEGVDKGIHRKLAEVVGKGQMAKLSKHKMKDLAGDMVEGRQWVRELEMRRGGKPGVGNEKVEEAKA
ncbi:hypothetical protein K469DRAFT_130518 [Zopfia rhizophila CBS 207.26]|uniref:Uncharacterized protein n=1 Tax=Zopfia rhizophila CBS 207.26 TaxID=1314779 RepID=A0A6A6EUC3_9PEZI|nr:hypothetical protein K469DRAFT_130518 [Zopfia rhizophila CBS 207.26]